MNDTQQMFKAIINGQHALKASLEKKIDKVDEKLTGRIDKLDKKLDRVEKNLTERIDKLGRQLAYLEEDSPTREEYDSLEVRVQTVEKKPAPAL